MSYTINIPFKVYQRLQAYTAIAKGEIGGLGRVTVDEKTKEFTISEVFLIEQEACASECELSAEGLANLYDELLTAGKDVNDIKLWWHSHANMDAFLSKTDDTTMNEWPGDWLIALVINKKDKIIARLQIQKPVMMYMDLEPNIVWPTLVDMAEAEAEVAEKVKYKTYTVQKPPNHLVDNKKTDYQDRWHRPWYLEIDETKPLNKMTDAEYSQIMMEEYDGTPLVFDDMSDEEEAAVWDDWVTRYMQAELLDNLSMKIDLVDEALSRGILTEEEVDAFLNEDLVKVIDV